MGWTGEASEKIFNVPSQYGHSECTNAIVAMSATKTGEHLTHLSLFYQIEKFQILSGRAEPLSTKALQRLYVEPVLCLFLFKNEVVSTLRMVFSRGVLYVESC